MNNQSSTEILPPVDEENTLYRLYYNEEGLPLFFSQEDIPGAYITVSRTEYFNPPKHFKVVNSKIVILDDPIIKPLNTVYYRLYYDDQDSPLFFSQEDLPGNYIDITREVYINPPKHFKLIDKKIVVLDSAEIKKLKAGSTGTPCHPTDITVVVDQGRPNIKWSLQ